MSSNEKKGDAYKKISGIIGDAMSDAFHKIMHDIGDAAKSEGGKNVKVAGATIATSELKDFLDVMGSCDLNLIFFPTFAAGRNAKHSVSEIARSTEKGASVSIGFKVDF